MKKYLSVFFYTFIMFFSFASGQAEPTPEELPIDINLSFAELKNNGMTADRFIDLLEHPPCSIHPRIFSWIDELLNLNDPDIDHRLIQLLLTDRWINSSDQEDVNKWMAILIRREFANDQEITAMFEEKPWKSHLVSSIARDTLNYMANDSKKRS